MLTLILIEQAKIEAENTTGSRIARTIPPAIVHSRQVNRLYQYFARLLLAVAMSYWLVENVSVWRDDDQIVIIPAPFGQKDDGSPANERNR